MRTLINFSLCATAVAMLAINGNAQQPPAAAQAKAKAPPPPMSFFITSVGNGKGANLGGLAGADAHCQMLATAANAGDRTWHAYLSTQARNGQAAVNARDRIGTGPWYNATGQEIAQNLATLHGDTAEQARVGNNVLKARALTETGKQVNGVGDTPNTHDMMTGSTTDGRAYTDNTDHTCGNWTSEAADGIAQLGHFDRNGGGVSWNSAHPSRGCSQPNLVATGGAGLFYCFAIGPR
ncbi:MAG: lectin [Bryobacteraceae bacterium]